MAVRKNLTNFFVRAREFEYEAGVWEKPTKLMDAARLIYGDKIRATVAVDTYHFGNAGTMKLLLALYKPTPWQEKCFGWHDSQLEFKAVLGRNSATLPGLGKMFQEMGVGKAAKFFLEISLLDNTDPIHNKLQLILSDKATTPKVGLYLVDVHVYK